MLKTDFRQYEQIRTAREGAQKAVLCVLPDGTTKRQFARYEAANLLSGLLGNGCCKKTEGFSGICKN